MNIELIRVVDIDDTKRLRAINPLYVEELAASLTERDGMMTPIEVRNVGVGYVLVAGAHRLAAAKRLGWEMVHATIFKGGETDAQLREIDENLVRHDLTALDRAVFIARRQEIWDAQHPDVPRGKAGAEARWHAKDTMSFASNAAEKLGYSTKTITRALKLAAGISRLPNSMRARISASDLANKPSEIWALLALEDDATRQQVLDLILSEVEDCPVDVKSALGRIKNAPIEVETAEDKAFSAFRKAWEAYPAFRKKVRAYVAKDRNAGDPV